jgi:hypothetical protein
VGYLVELVAPEPDAVDAAFQVALSRLDEHGAGMVQATAIDGTWWRGALLEHGFRAPGPDNHLSVIQHPHAPAHPLAAAARNTAEWFFTDGDRDDATMG